MRKVRLGNLDLKIAFGKRAARMLLDFANAMPSQEGFAWFKARWGKDGWEGDLDDFVQTQSLVRDVWAGRKQGIEGIQAKLSLRLGGSEDGTPPSVRVDWAESALSVLPRNLHDVIWLTLIQYSQRLGICESHVKGENCPTPYFLKYRPQARFCSEACAVTAQREAKRRWWNEHGEEWLAKREANKSGGTKRSEK